MVTTAGRRNSLLIEKQSARELRHFGFTVGGVFAFIIGIAFPILKHQPLRPIPILIGAPFLLLALVQPRLLEKPQKGWVWFGEKLGWFNSRVILGIVFGLIVIPMGMIKRLTGRKATADNVVSFRIKSEKLEPATMERTF